MRIESNSSNIIYPDIDNGFEFLIEPCIELMLKNYGMYYFSSSFKLSDCIVKSILNKYSKNKERFSLFQKNKGNLYINNEEKNIETEILNEFKEGIKRNNISENDILAYYVQDKNFFIVAKQKLYFLKSDDVYEIKYIQFEENNKFYSQNEKGEIFNIVFSKKFIYLIKELKELGKKVDVSKNKNPLRNISEKHKKIYIEIVIYMCFFNKETTSGQIFRLEQIARQFNICSNEILEMIKYVDNVSKENYIGEIYKLKELLPDKYNEILFIDLFTLNILGNKCNKDSTGFVRKMEKLLDIKYSRMEQVKRKLTFKLNEVGVN